MTVSSIPATAMVSLARWNSSASDSSASATATATPAYTITDAPGAAAVGQKKWGRFVLRGIRGHTKKLNPVARQVCANAWIATTTCQLVCARDVIASRITLLSLPLCPFNPTSQVVGLCVPEAMAQMSYSQVKRKDSVKTAIQRACWNADFYHNIQPTALMVDEAWTGKELSSPRVRHHSKGRFGLAHYRTSVLTVKVRAMTPVEADKLVKFPTLPSPANKAKLDPRGY